MNGCHEGRVAIFGGTGKIGASLLPALLEAGWQVQAFSRRQLTSEQPNLEYVQHQRDWQSWQGDELDDCQAVINLIGDAIDIGRWSNRRRQQLRDSRLLPSRAIAQQVADRDIPGLINASGVAAYPFTDSTSPAVDEQGPTDAPGFLAQLVRDWEACLEPALDRALILRLPLVLMPAARGGGLAKMLPSLGPIRLPVAKVGSGKQPLPWVHVDDVVGIICAALDRPGWRGVVNGVAPELVSNAEFTRQLAQVSGRLMLPLGIPPVFLRLAMGEAAQLAYRGQAVTSQVLSEQQYTWQYPQLADALRACQVT